MYESIGRKTTKNKSFFRLKAVLFVFESASENIVKKNFAKT